MIDTDVFSATVPSGSQVRTDTHTENAAGPAFLLDPVLAFAADILDDLEKLRIATENRLRILTDTSTHRDGKIRGFGLDESHPDVATLANQVHLLRTMELEAERSLARKLRNHPLFPWIRAQRGIGAKQAARLLAAIGDPYWRPERTVVLASGEEAIVPAGPRTVSALWAYCGLQVIPAEGFSSLGAGPYPVGAGAAPRRRRGEAARWSHVAKMRVYLIAQSCMKQLVKPCARVDDDGPAVHVEGCACSPYRVTYDQRRARTDSTHPEWTKAHRLNDALRVTAKAILRDLWAAAALLHRKKEEQAK